MRSVIQDVRFGLRLLIRQPGFTAIALVVLTLGIGVNTAAFGLANALMLKPRTGGIDGELAGVYSRNRTRPDTYREFSWADYTALREQTSVFRSVAGHSFGFGGLDEGGSTRRVFADIVTANFFETFGVSPVLGRSFTADEEGPGADIPVLILSYGLWQRLGGDPAIVGQSITVNARAFTIIGVAPRGFGGSMVMVTPDIWVPTGMYDSMAFEVRNEGEAARLGAPGFRALILVARLPQAATITSLAPRLDVVTRQMAAADPAANADYEIQIAPLSRISVSTRPQVDDELTTFLGLLLSLAAVVLLIASFNLANMLLARGRARSREFAIRLAIGGSHWRLVRQLLTESVVLALLGGIGGLVLSSWAMRFLFVNMPAVMPVSLAFDATPDIRVLASTVMFAVVSALVFGLGPAWRFARTDVLPELKEQAGEVPSRRLWLRWLTTRDALVMGQLALTFVMLTAAGLFVRGAIEAAESDPGFTLDRGIIANTDTTLISFSPTQSHEFYRRALEQLRRLPGVEVGALASHMPFSEFEDSVNVQMPGPPLHYGDPGAQGHLFSATTASIGAHYFAAMGVPVLRGRELSEAEEFASGGGAIAIIDETLARRLFPDVDPIGQSVQVADNREGAPPTLLRVVGVVGGVRPNLFDEGPRPFLYRPYGQMPRAIMYLHARTSAPTAEAEAAMLPTVRRMIAGLAPNPPIVSLETRPMFRERNLLLAMVRTGATLFAVLGIAALTLAAVGIYGVKSYLVSRRTREIGVRVALGAEPRDVVWMVIREGLLLIGAGLVVGAGLSLLTGQALRAVLFQGRALDVPVVLTATVTLVVSVLLASWVPARRATRVAPATALRSQ
jgi:predicted permease